MAAKAKKPAATEDKDDEVPQNAKSPKSNPKNLKKEPEEEKIPSAKPPKPIKAKKEGGIFSKILPLFVLLLVIASIVGVLFFNVLDIREKYLRSTLEKIPIVNNILPAPSGITDKYSAMNKDELIAQLKSLESEISAKDANIDALNQRIQTYTEQITTLKTYEAQQVAFKKEQEQFYKAVAEGDPEAYAAHYKSISPESAEQLYKEAVGVVAQSSEMKKYVNTVTMMDESSAAKMLEEMIGADMNLVVQIMKNINPEQRGAIMSAMDTTKSASLMKQMYPG